MFLASELFRRRFSAAAMSLAAEGLARGVVPDAPLAGHIIEQLCRKGLGVSGWGAQRGRMLAARAVEHFSYLTVDSQYLAYGMQYECSAALSRMHVALSVI